MYLYRYKYIYIYVYIIIDMCVMLFRFLFIFIDSHQFSSIFIDFHWFWMIFNHIFQSRVWGSWVFGLWSWVFGLGSLVLFVCVPLPFAVSKQVLPYLLIHCPARNYYITAVSFLGIINWLFEFRFLFFWFDSIKKLSLSFLKSINLMLSLSFRNVTTIFS